MSRSLDRLVVLAAGLGTRMQREGGPSELTAEQRAAAGSGLKAMMPFGRPFLDYVLHEAAEAGFTEVCLVIGPEHEPVRRYYEQLPTDRLGFQFAIQADRRGTAHALSCARAFADDTPLAMINADNLYPAAAFAALRRLDGSGLVGFTRRAMAERSNIAADRLAGYALIETDADRNLARITEKPPADTVARLGGNALISMNCWRFSPDIFQACARIEPSARGELEITDAVRWSIERQGLRYQVVPLDEPVFDLSQRGDVATMAAALAGRECRL